MGDHSDNEDDFGEEDEDLAESPEFYEDERDYGDGDPSKKQRTSPKQTAAGPIVKTSFEPFIKRGDAACMGSSALAVQIVDIEMQLRPRRPDLDDQEILLGFCTSNAASGKRSRVPLFSVPCMRVYGRLKDGASICVNVYGFYSTVHLLTSVEPTADVVAELVRVTEEALRSNDTTERSDDYRYVLSSSVVQGYPMYPYTEKPARFIQFQLSMPKAVRWFAKYYTANSTIVLDALGTTMVAPYSCLDIVDQFIADKDLKGFCWIQVSMFNTTDRNEERCDPSQCTFEIDATVDQVVAIKNEDSIAPLRVLTFDIECARLKKGMPQPDTDPVILIACICAEYEKGMPTGRARRVVLQNGSAKSLDLDYASGDIHKRYVKETAEMDMLCEFGGLVRDFDPDFIAGHNVVGFDLPYVLNRAHKIGASEAEFLGRRRQWKWFAPRETTTKRKNGETRKKMTVDTPGRIQLDTLPWIMGGLEKHRSYKLGYLASVYLGDTKADIPYQLITPFWRTSDETRGRLAHYCLKDTTLTHMLINHDKFRMIVTSVEIARQAMACANKLLRSGVQAKVFGLVYNIMKHPGFAPNPNTPVVIPHEVPKSRDRDDKYEGAIVLVPKRGLYLDPIACGDYRSLYPSIMILLNICWTTTITMAKYADKVGKTSPNGVKFCDAKHRVGLIPQIQTRLFADRDAAKAKMKETKDPAVKTLYDARQNQIKVLMNSMYGILGASGGRLVREELALAVTSQGKQMIMAAKAIAEGPPFNATVVYGDSVTGDTPVLCRNPGADIYQWRRIEDLVQDRRDWIYVGDKEFAPVDFEVWSDVGWTPIHRVIRHATRKPIWAVTTHRGCVTVTEDHSLLYPDSDIVKPASLKVGDPLLHSELPRPKHDDAIGEGDAYSAGAEAAVDRRGVPSRVYNCSNIETRKAFLHGYFDECAMINKLVDKSKGFGFQFSEQITAAEMYHLMISLGYPATIRALKHGVYKVTCRQIPKQSTPKKMMSVKSVHLEDNDFREDAYVYDLETGNHHFSAGIGEIVVHNTDSIFIKFPGVKTVADAFPILKDVCKAVTDFFAPSPVMLQPEKVMHPLLMVAKKRYAFKIFESPKDPGALKYKGLELARRDNCMLVPEVLERVLNTLMTTGKTEEARKVVMLAVRELLLGATDVSRLVITKSISKDDYKEDPIQLVVAKRMAKRDPDYQWGVADRIPYVIVRREGRTLADRAEDPLFAITHGYAVDEDYYVQKQLAGPVVRLLMWDLMDDGDKRMVATMEDTLRLAELTGNEASVASLKKAFDKEILRLEDRCRAIIFGNESMAAIPRRVTTSSRGICAFFKPERHVDQAQIEDLCKQKKELKEKCDLCRGYVDDALTCAARDCPTILKRAIVQQKISELTKK